MRVICVILFFFFAFISCNVEIDSFYKTNRVEDINVLPLIKPYRLFTPIHDNTIWSLKFKNKVKQKYGFEDQTNVCRINVVNRIIYGHCMEFQSYPNYYFVIIPDENIEKAFEFKNEWSLYLHEHGVNSDELYHVLNVYWDFKKDYRSLPWYDQIKNQE